MAIIKPDEMTLLKSTSFKLNDDVVALLMYQYHTERNEFGKVDHSKSKYRYLLVIDTIANFKALAQRLLSDECRMERFQWPNDYEKWYLYYGHGRTEEIGNWLNKQMKRANAWEKGQKVLEGWSFTATNPEGSFSPTSMYHTDNYVNAKGETISITDLDTMLKHIGETFIRQKTEESSKKKTMTTNLMK